MLDELVEIAHSPVIIPKSSAVRIQKRGRGKEGRGGKGREEGEGSGLTKNHRRVPNIRRVLYPRQITHHLHIRLLRLCCYTAKVEVEVVVVELGTAGVGCGVGDGRGCGAVLPVAVHEARGSEEQSAGVGWVVTAIEGVERM